MATVPAKVSPAPMFIFPVVRVNTADGFKELAVKVTKPVEVNVPELINTLAASVALPEAESVVTVSALVPADKSIPQNCVPTPVQVRVVAPVFTVPDAPEAAMIPSVAPEVTEVGAESVAEPAVRVAVPLRVINSVKAPAAAFAANEIKPVEIVAVPVDKLNPSLAEVGAARVSVAKVIVFPV